MTCGQIEERILGDDRAFLDQTVREHLKDCPDCNQLYEELGEIKQLQRSLARRETAPLNFTEQVLYRISRNSRLSPPLTIAAGFLLAALVVLFRVGTPPPMATVEPASYRVSPSVSPPASLLLDQAQPVEFDSSYPRIQIYILAPRIPSHPKASSRIEVQLANESQANYVKYVSH